MSKKRAPKTEATLATPNVETTTEPTAHAPLNDPTNAIEADKLEKSEKRGKKDKHSKKNKKEKATKAAKAEKAAKAGKKAKRDKPKGKKDKSGIASELRPLRKVNVRLIEPNGQPRAYFNGEIGVLDLLLPKAEGDDSGT